MGITIHMAITHMAMTGAMLRRPVVARSACERTLETDDPHGQPFAHPVVIRLDAFELL
ncbi:MAG: hypothetical protein WBO47_13905 [Gammaproteobacteria bacterium]